jgi:Asp-tRNA(Asn)/Glu-tRNA(Gln) amidotransferase A subunit family amidase
MSAQDRFTAKRHDMNALHQLSACDAAAQLAQRTLLAEDLVRACLEYMDAREPEVQAWAYVQRDAALAHAKQLDAGAHSGLLHGLPIGVKDLLATSDMPTTYGSAIYANYRPGFDAACVAVARQQGAVVVGKTVSTEFATFQPNQTRNPLRLTHTPGGSSSGSAAAVADSMVPLAIGTQTAGSLIRPASYCGIVAFKPSFGCIARAGAKLLSDTLDTVGTMARTVPDAALFAAAMSGRHAWLVKPLGEVLSRPLRIGICRTYEWSQADVDTQNALARAEQALKKARLFEVKDLKLPPDFETLAKAQTQVQLFEQAHNLAHEYITHFEGLSPRLQGILQSGKDVTHAQYDAALQHIDRCRQQLQTVFQDVDVLLAPSAQGEAPENLENTGDPVFCRIWTVLHTPAINVPAGLGAKGMPIGLQVVGAVGADALTLAAAHAVHQHLT